MNALHPREPKHIPSLEGLVDPNQVSRHLDAVAPPVEQQAAEAMGRIVREEGLIARQTGEHNSQPIVAISTPDGEPLYQGGITSEESVERLRLGLGFVAARDGHDQSPPKDLDDILFGTGANPIIRGEVLRKARPTPDATNHPTAPAESKTGRHARDKQRGPWRRRLVAGTMAAVALVGAFLSGDSESTHHNAAPRPSATTTPRPEAPHKVLPQPPSVSHRTIGHNSYEYTQNSQGEITTITGHLGQGESPWTLTAGAFELTHQEASPQAIASADYYMSQPALKEAAKSLPAGSAMTWRVSVAAGKSVLSPVIQ